MIIGNSHDVRYYTRIAQQVIKNTPPGVQPEYPWFGLADTTVARKVWTTELVNCGLGGETYNKFDLWNRFERSMLSGFELPAWRKWVAAEIGTDAKEVGRILHGNGQYYGCKVTPLVQKLIALFDSLEKKHKEDLWATKSLLKMTMKALFLLSQTLRLVTPAM